MEVWRCGVEMLWCDVEVRCGGVVWGCGMDVWKVVWNCGGLVWSVELSGWGALVESATCLKQQPHKKKTLHYPQLLNPPQPHLSLP